MKEWFVNRFKKENAVSLPKPKATPRTGLTLPSRSTVEAWYSTLKKPTPEESAEIRDSLVELAKEPTEAEVNYYFASLRPVTQEESLMVRDELLDFAKEMFPRPPYQPRLKL